MLLLSSERAHNPHCQIYIRHQQEASGNHWQTHIKFLYLPIMVHHHANAIHTHPWKFDSNNIWCARLHNIHARKPLKACKIIIPASAISPVIWTEALLIIITACEFLTHRALYILGSISRISHNERFETVCLQSAVWAGTQCQLQ